MKYSLFIPAVLTIFVNCFGGYHESTVINLSNDVIQKHHTLNNHAVTFNRGKFFVTDDNKTSVIKNHDIDTKLKTIDQKKLEAFLRSGYLQLKKYDNGDYKLQANVRGPGGFLLTGVIVHQTSRVIGHASVFASAGVFIVGAFVSSGPPGAAGAYLTVMATVPTAMATVESGALALGVAASFIPGLP